MTLAREEIADKLAAVGYIADRDIATALWLMEFLKRPLLLEGEAGVGKTEVAKALAAVHEAELIRLQCYEGLDQNAALYEWNYQRQLLAIKTREGIGENADDIEEHIFSEKYLLERPLLAAIRRQTPPVLLIDEVDRADEEFEAFLLELLSDFQVSIPELGTIKAIAMGQEIAYDADGNVKGASLMDFFLPTAVETPHWETDYTVTPSPHHPIGAKGVGESPNVGGVPCFSNAVNDAFAFLGSTHIQMPHDHWRTWTAAEKLGLHG